MEQPLDAKYVEIDDVPPCEVLARLGDPETTTVEGEPNEVEVGRKPVVLMVGDDARDEVRTARALNEMAHRKFRRDRLGGSMGGLMGLIMTTAAMGESMMAGRMPVTRDVPAPTKKCLLCGKESTQPFCCGDHARLWKQYKKAERGN